RPDWCSPIPCPEELRFGVGSRSRAASDLMTKLKMFPEDHVMSCDEQRKLRGEEIRAWSAYKKLENSGSEHTDEVRRYGDNANLASSRLHQHLEECPDCRPKQSARFWRVVPSRTHGK